MHATLCDLVHHSPEFWEKKLHAAKVNLKRAIKKAKDLHVRKLVKKLKAKQTDALDAELRRAKEVDLDGLWTRVLDGTLREANDVDRREGGAQGDEKGNDRGNGNNADNAHDTNVRDVERRLSRNDGVVRQMVVVEEIRDKLEQARQGREAETTADAGNSPGGDPKRRNKKDENEKKTSGEDEDSGADTEDERGNAEDRTTSSEGEDGSVEDPHTQRHPTDKIPNTSKHENSNRNTPTSSKGNNQKKKEKKKPKNRMGQRARQRLAEKQYGKDKALHIIENRARDQKRREQQEREKNKERYVEGGKVHGKDSSGAGDRKRSRKDATAGSEDPAALHPSWQAKKALTQKLVIPDISGSAAKNKIVFD